MDDLVDILQRQLQPHSQAPGWCVALSGGLDSSVLLHGLAELARRQSCPPLRAVHVHHGLQAVADSWPEHCRQLCAPLGIELQVVQVQVAAAASTEQAARQARYQALAGQLQQGELLLVAQHQDDQSETLLLRLLRGSGVLGLQAMPVSRPLGRGLLLRPLLAVSRLQLESWAQQKGLSWVEDPSNAHEHYDRNFLRLRILPLLRQRWRGLDAVLQRTAGHMTQAQELLDELALLDVQQAIARPTLDWLELPCLDLDVVRVLSAARQRNLLRYWLRDKTLLPDSTHWAGWDSLLNAGAAAQPLWRLQGGVLQRHAGRLYWLEAFWMQPPPWLELSMEGAGDYCLPGNGRLRVDGPNAAGLQLRWRQGGEQMCLPGRGRRDLKRLLQEQQVPVFVRDRLPLLFAGQQLVAVAGLPELRAAGFTELSLSWQPPTSGPERCFGRGLGPLWS